MNTGRIQARAKPVERVWVQILREAGATVHPQKLLREVTALAFDPHDTRRIDALATGLPYYHGRPLFCDATLRCPNRRNGEPHPHCATTDGATFPTATADKTDKYDDVQDSPHAQLLGYGSGRTE